MSVKKASYKTLRPQTQFLKMIAANVVSRFGDSLDAIAFSWIMYQVTGSASLIALILALNHLPNILLMPFSGVFADRFSKKKIMVFCDFGRAAMVCLTAVLFSLNRLTPLLLIGITLVNSTLESFRIPAGSALVPKILDRDKYDLGLSLNQSLNRVAELVGTAFAGGIVALLGSSTALFIDAATFIFSAVVISLIRCQEIPVDEAFSFKLYGRRLAEGFRCMKSSRILLFIGLLGMLTNFSCAAFSAFQTPYVGDTLGQGPETLSLLGIAITVGMMLCSFLYPKLSARLSARSLLAFAGLGLAFSHFLLAMLPLWKDVSFLLLLLLAFSSFLLGAGMGLVNMIFSASFMAHVPEEMMGRINGIMNALLLLMSPLGAFLCSGLALFLSIPVIFVVFGILIAVLFLTTSMLHICREL